MLFRQTFARIRRRLRKLNVYHRLRRLEMTVAELEAAVDTANTLIAKIGGETTGLIAKATDLQKEIDDLRANGVNIPQSLADKATALITGLKGVDDLVPDAPPAP